MNKPITGVFDSDTANVMPPPNTDWPPIIPFGNPRPPQLDLDVVIPDGLESLRAFLRATAEAVQVPTDAVAPLAVGVISLTASRSFEVELMPQWRETAPLWIAVLAEPGERKSATLGALAAPLYSWQGDERDRLRPELARYAERRIAVEARLNGIRKMLSKPPKDSNPAQLETEALKLACLYDSMPALASPELITADATPEAMRALLVRNGEKLALVSAETDFEQLTGSRYGTGSPNMNLMLAGKSGDALPSHRVGRDEPLNRPALAGVLFVQPTAVRAVMCDANATGRGLVSRFAFIVPTSRMGSRSLMPPAVPVHLLKWWEATVCSILEYPWPGRVVLGNNGPHRSAAGPRTLTLDARAEAAFLAFRTDIEARLKGDGDLHSLSGFASKLPGEVARIALSLQLTQDTHSTLVTGATMTAACKWGPFLIAHHRAALGDAAERVERRHARRLVAALRRRGKEKGDVTERDCFNLIDGADVPTMGAVKPIMDEVIDANVLRPASEDPKHNGRGRRSSPRYEVNPSPVLDPIIKTVVALTPANASTRTRQAGHK